MSSLWGSLLCGWKLLEDLLRYDCILEDVQKAGGGDLSGAWEVSLIGPAVDSNLRAESGENRRGRMNFLLFGVAIEALEGRGSLWTCPSPGGSFSICCCNRCCCRIMAFHLFLMSLSLRTLNTLDMDVHLVPGVWTGWLR